MSESTRDPRGFTVGSLQGMPIGESPSARMPGAEELARQGAAVAPDATDGEGWIIAGGEVRKTDTHVSFRTDGVEALIYNNPFNMELERVWFDGKVVYAVELGELDVDPAQVKVAQEYQIVYSVELDERGKLKEEPERVPGQYNIYDSVPGMEQYSPIWQFNYVVVPRDYVPNTLRSEHDCLQSGYPVKKSTVLEN